MIVSGRSHSTHSRVTSTLAFKVHQILSSKCCTVTGWPPTIAGPSFALCEHNTNKSYLSTCRCGQEGSRAGSSSSGSYSTPAGLLAGGRVRKAFAANYKINYQCQEMVQPSRPQACCSQWTHIYCITQDDKGMRSVSI